MVIENNHSKKLQKIKLRYTILRELGAPKK